MDILGVCKDAGTESHLLFDTLLFDVNPTNGKSKGNVLIPFKTHDGARKTRDFIKTDEDSIFKTVEFGYSMNQFKEKTDQAAGYDIYGMPVLPGYGMMPPAMRGLPIPPMPFRGGFPAKPAKCIFN